MDAPNITEAAKCFPINLLFESIIFINSNIDIAEKIKYICIYIVLRINILNHKTYEHFLYNRYEISFPILDKYNRIMGCKIS